MAYRADLIQYARDAARRKGVDADIFQRMIQQESGFDDEAESPAGARGIAQIMPQFHPGVNPNNPEASLDYAAGLIAGSLQDYGGDYRLALAAYNAGPGAVQQHGGIPPFPETQQYIARILGGEAQPRIEEGRPNVPEPNQVEVLTDWQQVPEGVAESLPEGGWMRKIQRWNASRGTWLLIDQYAPLRTEPGDPVTPGWNTQITEVITGSDDPSRGAVRDPSLDGLRAIQGQVAQAQTALEKIESDRRDAREKRDYDRLVILDGRAEEQRQIVNRLNQEKWELEKEVTVAGITGEYAGMPTLAKRRIEAELGLSVGTLTGYYDDKPTLSREEFAARDALARSYLALAEGNAEEAKRQFDVATGFDQRLAAAKFQFEVERDPTSFVQKLYALSGETVPGGPDIAGSLRPYDPGVVRRGPPGTATGAPRGEPQISEVAPSLGPPQSPEEWAAIQEQMRQGTLRPLNPPGYVSPQFPQGISQEQYAGLQRSGVIPTIGMGGSPAETAALAQRASAALASPQISPMAPAASAAPGVLAGPPVPSGISDPDQEAQSLAEEIRRQRSSE